MVPNKLNPIKGSLRVLVSLGLTFPRGLVRRFRAKVAITYTTAAMLMIIITAVVISTISLADEVVRFIISKKTHEKKGES